MTVRIFKSFSSLYFIQVDSAFIYVRLNEKKQNINLSQTFRCHKELKP